MNNTAHSSADGFFVQSFSNMNMTGNLAYNVTGQGYHCVYSNDSVYEQNVAKNNSENGIFFNGCQRIRVENNTAFRNGHGGITLANAGNMTITDNLAYNNSEGFMVTTSSSDNNLTYNRAVNNSFGFSIEIGSDSNLIYNNTAYDNSKGFWCYTGWWNNYTLNLAYDNTQRGFDFDSCRNLTVTDNTAYDNAQLNYILINTSNSTIYNNLAYGTSGYGFVLYNDADSNNLSGNRAYNHSTHGIYLTTDCDYNNVFNNTAYNSLASGINVTNSASNNFSNNTIENNAFGVFIDASASNNLFYFNDFINSTLMHAYAGAAGNHFNTTNGSACGNNCSRGNFWDDVAFLRIFDDNQDGFGEWGADYPYNSTNGGNVSGFVQDFGPITVKTSAPEGSIIIVGPNGTIITGTRSVFLNLSYFSYSPIAGCRWANDNVSALDNATLEECTTVKAWLLSEGEGNKTVYYQIFDTGGGNATFNDSIIYHYTQDYTAPTPPTVYDGSQAGVDIDWWNSNTTLHANWFNATEDISTIYYRYRILNNSVCSGTCAWTDAGTNTSMTATGLNLSEGRNYSVQVMAYNPFGYNATIATSNGTIIDLTEPNPPDIDSSTHPTQTMPYNTATAIFNFSATDPISNSVSSGIEGFSYVLDRHPGTAPDRTMEARYWEILTQQHKGSYNQTLKANGTGAAFAVYSQLATNVSPGEQIRVKVTLAEQVMDYDDLMAVKVYLMRRSGNGNSITTFDNEASAVSSIAYVSQDIRYAETMATARDYQFDLTVNDTVDDTTDDLFIVVAGVTVDDDNRDPLAIAGTTTESLIDNTTRNYVCDESDNCQSNTSTLDYAIRVERQDSGTDWSVQYDYLGDGTYYFHVKAKDRAGNWGDTSHYRIMVAAGGVSSIIYSPVDGEYFVTNTTERNITVSVRVSGNASAWVVAKHPDGSNFTSSQQVTDSTADFENITLEVGLNELYAVTNTSAGAVARSPSVYVTLSTDLLPVTNKTLRINYPGSLQALCRQTLH
jgi:parallel beta-helix repeat protein